MPLVGSSNFLGSMCSFIDYPSLAGLYSEAVAPKQNGRREGFKRHPADENKWASCSSNGRLTFNSEILHQPASFRREAIVHELLHLKVPNHGKLFKNLMRTY